MHVEKEKKLVTREGMGIFVSAHGGTYHPSRMASDKERTKQFAGRGGGSPPFKYHITLYYF